jgi:hypothetical protein
MVCCYENNSKPFFFGDDVRADVRHFAESRREKFKAFKHPGVFSSLQPL